MSGTLTDIPKVTSATRAQRSLRTCLEELVTERFPGPNPSERLTAMEWQRVSGFDLNRVLRRIVISRTTPLGVLSRKAYGATYKYCRQQRKFFNGFSDVGYRTHVLRHAGWDDATVLCAEHREEKLNHSIGVWAFVPAEFELLDTFEFREIFNGSGPDFFTPLGKFNKSSHRWNWSSETTDGSIFTGGRDWTSRQLTRDRFQGRLLPNLNLPENCRLYSVNRHARYY